MQVFSAKAPTGQAHIRDLARRTFAVATLYQAKQRDIGGHTTPPPQVRSHMNMDAPMKYTNTQITFHWVTFGLVMLMAATGMAYFYEVGGNTPMMIHQIAGQALIVVLALRLATRLIRPAPANLQDHAGWERALAGLIHVALYGTLIVFVVTGYISASGLDNPRLIAPVSKAFAWSDTGEWLLEVHYATKWVLLGLVGLHVLGALKHHLWDKDTTLSNMTFHKTGDT